jgi:hypothetical protein
MNMRDAVRLKWVSGWYMLAEIFKRLYGRTCKFPHKNYILVLLVCLITLETCRSGAIRLKLRNKVLTISKTALK